jgi:hypothetical protein
MEEARVLKLRARDSKPRDKKAQFSPVLCSEGTEVKIKIDARLRRCLAVGISIFPAFYGGTEKGTSPGLAMPIATLAPSILVQRTLKG